MSIEINSSQYKIIDKIGEGGFGKIYKVFNEKTNLFYAIKEFSIKDEKEENIKYIQKEADILSSFNSNSIVKYYGSSQINDKFYILMEYCDSGNLKNFIDKFRAKDELIKENKLKYIINKIILGIQEIHDKNIIHRDLKPENIFLNNKNEIKIGDFGVARQLTAYKKYTLTKGIGTLYYSSPEILKGNNYDNKVDIWSLGCIIYELFNLSIYHLDKISNEVKSINEDYNPKWQELINLLFKIDFSERPNIYQIKEFLNFNNSNEERTPEIREIINPQYYQEIMKLNESNKIQKIQSKKNIYNLLNTVLVLGAICVGKTCLIKT